MNRLDKRGFTVLELLVAVSVTALLAAMLFTITSQVVKTQTQSSGDLETNQVAQFILDRIQEDLQCAILRNDGNNWFVASILGEEPADNSNDAWSENLEDNPKPVEASLRVSSRHWEEQGLEVDEILKENEQGPLTESRFGKRGVWLRFFTQAPEVDPDAKNSGAARAVGYQIIRHGLISDSQDAQPRYQLFRTDVSDENTLRAGYNLDPLFGDEQSYGQGSQNQTGIRQTTLLKNPIITMDGYLPTTFSMAANVIDFGIRAYTIEKESDGYGYLDQIFPDVRENGSTDEYELVCSSKGDSFPQVVDVMLRILTSEGASVIALFEEGKLPVPSSFKGNAEDYWWELAEENSDVFVRRIKVFSNGI